MSLPRSRRWSPSDSACVPADAGWSAVVHLMDILAHGLWAGAGLALAQRRLRLPQRIVVTTVVLAVLPDLAHLLPTVAWALFGDGSFAAVHAYAVAMPGQEPVSPALVELLSHHLHCILHSAVVAAVVTALMWTVLRAWWIPLLGWWSHIVIDVFTHSADFYPVPVLYPFTQRGFDGLAWNTPWFMVVNYAALAGVWAWLLHKRSKPPVKPGA